MGRLRQTSTVVGLPNDSHMSFRFLCLDLLISGNNAGSQVKSGGSVGNPGLAVVGAERHGDSEPNCAMPKWRTRNARLGGSDHVSAGVRVHLDHDSKPHYDQLRPLVVSWPESTLSQTKNGYRL